ncbi:uncharacterized protein LOC131682875 isoform X1 [Topomyia yanbarensis]|uniref:uncharacterized protein LOC131682875 isoform X1 n=1 Tax=Topomyia yanbarensis TaxID=2498891 RepID=UPI00273C2D93|nr:uncharacterized protein LOC131682875 isoform X1 [Topomyia yanbarensis]
MYESVSDLITEMRCDVALTETKIQSFMTCSKNMMDKYNRFIIGLINNFVLLKGLNCNDEAIINLINGCELPNLFVDVQSFERNLAFLSGKFKCAIPEPREIVLGKTKKTTIVRLGRTVRRFGRSCRKAPLVKKNISISKDRAHYISIRETLAFIMQNTTARQMIDDEHSRLDGTLCGFKDGKRFGSHEFLTKYPNTIRLSMHIDEGEYLNPLGSRKGNNKLTNITFKIQNFDPIINSSLDRVYIALMVHSKVIKKYGYKKVLEPLVEDLKMLSAENGVVIQIGSEAAYTLRALVVNVLGDTMAIHDVFELMPPQSSLFCRMCYIERNFFLSGSYGEVATIRTPESIASDLVAICNKTKKPNEVGIKQRSSLHDIPFFHIANNFTFDPMHDLLEGVVSMVIKLILHNVVNVKKLISISDVNNRIKQFHYGDAESSDKPSSNFTIDKLKARSNAIGQSAAQTWTLLRSFPFLFWDVLNNAEQYVQIIGHLLKITYYCFSYQLKQSMLSVLDDAICNFFVLFKTCFPLSDPINKVHHLAHYKRVIDECGPIANFSCMQFEAKFKESKNQSKTCNNFKNLTYSLTKRLNLRQIYGIHHHNYDLRKTDIFSMVEIEKDSLDYALLIFDLPKTVSTIRHMKINGTSFKPGLVVKYNICEQNEFGLLKAIILSNDDKICILQKLNCLRFCSNSFSYIVEVEEQNIRVSCAKLLTRKTYSLWRCFDREEEFFYISVKYVDE